MKTKVAVRFVLKQHGLTEYALAQRLGCTPTSVSQWLKRTRMSHAYANKLRQEFGVMVTDAV